VILKDPKVLSVLPLKKRGEKGWRELQGDSLRELLLELIRKEVQNVAGRECTLGTKGSFILNVQ